MWVVTTDLLLRSRIVIHRATIPLLLSLLQPRWQIPSYWTFWSVLLEFSRQTCWPTRYTRDHKDSGSCADTAKQNLLGPETKTNNISHTLAQKSRGFKSFSWITLVSTGSLYATQKKLSTFRDQDFKDLSTERQIEITASESTLA